MLSIIIIIEIYITGNTSLPCRVLGFACNLLKMDCETPHVFSSLILDLLYQLEKFVDINYNKCIFAIGIIFLICNFRVDTNFVRWTNKLECARKYANQGKTTL